MIDTAVQEQTRTRPKPNLRRIQDPISEELELFRQRFRDSMRSDVKLLDRVVRYVLRSKGKQIRPVLVLLSAKACGGVSDTSYTAASLVELLHTATLVHDDIVDEAPRRRGLFSVWALWKSKIAVLFGDYLLSRGLLLALDNRDYDMLHVVSDAVRRMSEGELLQIEKARHLDIDEATYFRIISDKTASLIAACTTCGAVSATNDPDVADRMRQFGEELGLAFQIRDDLFDFGVDDVGKPLGIDVQEKKLTLPLIHALRQADPAERKHILKLIRKDKKSRADLRTVARFTEERGGLAYARQAMLDRAEHARSLLHELPLSDARDALETLVDYVVYRKK